MRLARAGSLPENKGARRQNRPGGVDFVFPYYTARLSTTGRKCPSSCAHCGGVYLQNMLPLEDMFRIRSDVKSYLVSGGCNKKGKIPHLEKINELQALSQKGPINLHSGLVTEEEAEKLGRLAEVVSFDLVLDREVIAGVYGFDVSTEDYLFSYRALQKYVRVVPHLCLGLKAGKIDKEYETLELLREEKPEAVCFLIFTPTPGTSFARCQPPPLDTVFRFLEMARRMLPSAFLHLGCMRPGGPYRAELDSRAIRIGIDRIVQPAPPARKMAREARGKITWSEECCCFDTDF